MSAEIIPKFTGYKIIDCNLSKKKYVNYSLVARDKDLDNLNEEVAAVIGITLIDLIYDKEKRIIYKPGNIASHLKHGRCVIVIQGCRKNDSRMVALISSSVKKSVVVVNLSDLCSSNNNEVTTEEMDEIAELTSKKRISTCSHSDDYEVFSKKLKQDMSEEFNIVNVNVNALNEKLMHLSEELHQLKSKDNPMNIVLSRTKK